MIRYTHKKLYERSIILSSHLVVSNGIAPLSDAYKATALTIELTHSINTIVGGNRRKDKNLLPPDYILKGEIMNKYRNKPIWIDGIRFDSIHEGNRWQELRLLERAGAVILTESERPASPGDDPRLAIVVDDEPAVALAMHTN